MCSEIQRKVSDFGSMKKWGKGASGRAMDLESLYEEKIHCFGGIYQSNHINIAVVETGGDKEEACILERPCGTSLLGKSNCYKNQDDKIFRTGPGPGLVKRANILLVQLSEC